MTKLPTQLADQEFGEIGEQFLGGAQLAQQIAGARAAARSLLPCLILGETGTGKERLARAIHTWSGRGAFHALNCAAIPPQLAEAMLFGYRRGAFTGAQQSALGHLRAASGGTLFLDEINELALAVQAKLLRALELGEVTPLGSTETIPIDIRLIAAGQPRLLNSVAEGGFREDLYARISGLTVTLTPLRQRREDILPLFCHFMALHTKKPPAISARVAETLCLAPWPRNVREVKLLAERLFTLCSGHAELHHAQLPVEYQNSSLAQTLGQPPCNFDSRRDHDLHQLKAALHQQKGNLKAAAHAIGISRARAYRLLSGRKASELLDVADSIRSSSDASEYSENVHDLRSQS